MAAAAPEPVPPTGVPRATRAAERTSGSRPHRYGSHRCRALSYVPSAAISRTAKLRSLGGFDESLRGRSPISCGGSSSRRPWFATSPPEVFLHAAESHQVGTSALRLRNLCRRSRRTAPGGGSAGGRITLSPRLDSDLQRPPALGRGGRCRYRPRPVAKAAGSTSEAGVGTCRRGSPRSRPPIDPSRHQALVAPGTGSLGLLSQGAPSDVGGARRRGGDNPRGPCRSCPRPARGPGLLLGGLGRGPSLAPPRCVVAAPAALALNRCRP